MRINTGLPNGDNRTRCSCSIVLVRLNRSVSISDGIRVPVFSFDAIHSSSFSPLIVLASILVCGEGTSAVSGLSTFRIGLQWNDRVCDQHGSYSCFSPDFSDSLQRLSLKQSSATTWERDPFTHMVRFGFYLGKPRKHDSI